MEKSVQKVDERIDDQKGQEEADKLEKKEVAADCHEGDVEKKKKKKKNKSNVCLILEKKVEEEEEMEEDNPFPLKYSKKGAKMTRFQDNSPIVNLKNWGDGPTTQTIPPTKIIDQQFPETHWEKPGLVIDYVNEQAWRSTSEDTKKKDLLWSERLAKLRKAAEVHRQVRKHAQSIARPGIKLVDLCQQIETSIRYIIQADGLEGGQAFPTGCSLNHIAAHYTPNYGDDTILSMLSTNNSQGRCNEDRFWHSHRWPFNRLCIYGGIRAKIRKSFESFTRRHKRWYQACRYRCETLRCRRGYSGSHGELGG